MTILTFQPRREAASPSKLIEFREVLYDMDYANKTMSFTEEGRAYYTGWFKRFGFTLDAADPLGFVETVMFINREMGSLQRDKLAQQLAGMSDEDKALWDPFVNGDVDGFAQVFRARAEKIGQSPRETLAQVVALRLH